MNNPARDGQTAACAACDGTGIEVLPNFSTAEARVCACSRRCTQCGGARYQFSRDAAGRDLARPCACALREMRVRRYNEARLPSKFADARLNSRFRDKENERAFSMFKLLAAEFRPGHKGIVLMGDAGVGKSFLVAAFLYEIIVQHGIAAQFQDFFHLLKDLRSGYSQDRPESELIEPLVNIDVLAIDELGKGRNTPWEKDILDVIISQRYNNRKTTIFTSNYTDSRATTLVERVRSRDWNPGDGEVELRDTLQDRVGSRIYSRLREMCDFVTLSGHDRREVL